MELFPIQHRVWAQQNGNKWQAVTVDVLYRNKRDLFVKVTLLMPKTFVLALNKVFVILKCVLLKFLKMYLHTLGRVRAICDSIETTPL